MPQKRDLNPLKPSDHIPIPQWMPLLTIPVLCIDIAFHHILLKISAMICYLYLTSVLAWERWWVLGGHLCFSPECPKLLDLPRRDFSGQDQTVGMCDDTGRGSGSKPKIISWRACRVEKLAWGQCHMTLRDFSAGWISFPASLWLVLNLSSLFSSHDALPSSFADLFQDLNQFQEAWLSEGKSGFFLAFISHTSQFALAFYCFSLCCLLLLASVSGLG